MATLEVECDWELPVDKVVAPLDADSAPTEWEIAIAEQSTP